MHSMETFIPYELNKAERDMDASKVLTLGPFALVLKYTFQESKSENFDWDQETFVYKGT